MTFARRRWVALVIAPFLVVGLAACAGVEPEALPTPTPTPTPTVEAPPKAKPGSRVPLSCDELAAVPSEFGPVTVSAVDWAMDLVLAGFANCQFAATVAELPVRLELAIVPEVTDEQVTFFSVDDPHDPSVVGFAGDGSGAGCQSIDGEAVFCEAVAFAERYTVVVNLHPDGYSVPAEPALSVLASVVSDLVSALDDAGEPLPAWNAGANVLTYPSDCMTEMAAVDQPIIAAVPFESGPATMLGSGDGPLIYSVAARRASTTFCEWYTIGSGPYASVMLEVLPGAEFAIDDGLFSPEGIEVDVPGADRAWQAVTADGRYDLTVVADHSIVTLRYSPPYDGSDPDPTASVLAVMDAVIATAPRR